MLSDLRDGIPRGELVLHYQPKIDLSSGRRASGVEALVRWRHPTDGLLMPDQFLPDAERSELPPDARHDFGGQTLRVARRRRALLDADRDPGLVGRE